jgi:hypothetical protein
MHGQSRSAHSRTRAGGAPATLELLAMSAMLPPASAPATSSSRGRSSARSSAASSGVPQRRTKKAPVETSRKAPAPDSPDQATDPSRLSSLPSSRPGSESVPGVTTRTTSRRTSPFALAGSSTWSQIAALRPAASSLAR